MIIHNFLFNSGKTAPSSVKLDPLFLTKKERLESENISSKTKAEIMIKLKGMDLELLEVFEAECIEVKKVCKFILNIKWKTLDPNEEEV